MVLQANSAMRTKLMLACCIICKSVSQRCSGHCSGYHAVPSQSLGCALEACECNCGHATVMSARKIRSGIRFTCISMPDDQTSAERAGLRIRTQRVYWSAPSVFTTNESPTISKGKELRMRAWGRIAAFALIAFVGTTQALPASAAEGAGKEAALKASDMTAKLFPEKVFFR